MKIAIGVATYDSKLHVKFVQGYTELIQTGKALGYEVALIAVPGCALVQNARNLIFKTAMENGFDYLLFIDADIGWTADDAIKLLSTGEDFVAGAYRLKTDKEVTFAVKEMKKPKIKGTLVEMDFVATGFLAISRKAMIKLWSKSQPYSDGNHTGLRMVTEVGIKNGKLYGEDTYLCRTWKKLGGKVYLQTTCSVDHIGEKTYSGNISEMYAFGGKK